MKASKLEKLREQIFALKTEITEVNEACLSDTDIEARLDCFIQEMKDAVDRDVLGFTSMLAYKGDPASGPGSWPRLSSWANKFPGTAFALSVTLNPEAFKALVLPATLKHTIGKRQEPGMERDGLIAQLSAQLRTLEQDEEAEVVRLEDSGVDVLRRADADPSVVLGFIA